MDEKLFTALQNQFNYERYSADVYYALASTMKKMGLDGACKFFHSRESEERNHAMKFSDYLADRDKFPSFGKIESISFGSLSCLEAMKVALEHEKKVTARIEALAQISIQTEDMRTLSFLDWFLTEQVEEEASLQNWIMKFEIAGSNESAILMLDHEMGE